MTQPLGADAFFSQMKSREDSQVENPEELLQSIDEETKEEILLKKMQFQNTNRVDYDFKNLVQKML